MRSSIFSQSFSPTRSAQTAGRVLKNEGRDLKRASIPKSLKGPDGKNVSDSPNYYFGENCEVEIRGEAASSAQTTANNDTSSPAVQVSTDSVCAVDIFGMSLEEAKKTYGLKQNGSAYTIDGLPFELHAAYMMDDNQYIMEIIITGNGALDDKIHCGMTYNELLSVLSQDSMTQPEYSEYYLGIAVSCFPGYTFTLVWDTDDVNSIGDMPCSKIELYSEF